MHSTQVPHHSDAVLAEAVLRRDDAREGYERLAGLAAAAAGTPAEDESVDLRDAGHARLAARDAWVGWIRDGV